MVVFLGAAFAAPLLSSFLDAAIVSVFAGEHYWSIWTTRVVGNSLTELTLVPPAVILWIVIASSGRCRAGAGTKPRRWVWASS